MSPGPERGAAPERHQLIESHLPLVRAIASRYADRGEPLDDLIQIGAVALVRAGDRFDPERGVTFASFAAPAVEGEIRRHLSDRTGPVRVPRQLRQMTGELARSRAELAASLGRTPSTDELAVALGVEQRDIERALEAERARELAPAVSDEALEAAGDTGSLQSTDDRLLLARVAEVLDERERRIVFLRFHADMTEREIAGEVGISQAQVSRLLARALAKLRRELDQDDATTGAGDIAEKAVISPVERPAEDQIRESAAEKRQLPKVATTRIPSVGTSEEQARPGAEVEAPPRSSQREKASGHSGRFLVRMPSALHAELSRAAEREHVSLNRFVTSQLAASVESPASPAPPKAPSPPEAPAAPVPAARRRRFRMLLMANLAVLIVAAGAAIALLVLAVQRGI